MTRVSERIRASRAHHVPRHLALCRLRGGTTESERPPSTEGIPLLWAWWFAQRAGVLMWALAFGPRSSVSPPMAEPPQPSMSSMSSLSTSAEPLNILSLDGGGMRGRNLLAMVEEIEAAVGSPVASCFDLVAGTSIGGCGALFLSCYPEPGEATRMAREALHILQTRCFAYKEVSSLLTRGHLCRDERREMMLELCGEHQPLRQRRGTHGPRAFAVATRCGAAGLEPYLFRTYTCGTGEDGSSGGDSDADERVAEASAPPLAGTSDAELWQAIEATSAAPVIFPTSALRGMRLADGGLVANNPTLLALREARALWPGRPIGLVVSLGCGSSAPASEDVAATERAVRHAAGGGEVRYFRLQPTLPKRGVSPMESDEPTLAAMEAAVRAEFRASATAREVCRRLAHSRVGWRRVAAAAERTRRWWRGAACVCGASASSSLEAYARWWLHGGIWAAVEASDAPASLAEPRKSVSNALLAAVGAQQHEGASSSTRMWRRRRGWLTRV